MRVLKTVLATHEDDRGARFSVSVPLQIKQQC
jgi:hypothetical protein